MAALLALVPVFAIFLMIALAVTKLPIQRWTFPYRGVEITVRNFVLREEVLLDGRQVPNTRTDGDRTSWAEHTVTVRGEQVRIGVRSEGLEVVCEAATASETVYDSRRSTILTRPPAQEPHRGDPRYAALREILRALRDGDDPESIALAEELASNATTRLDAIAALRSTADAHEALGGGDRARDLIASHEEALAPILAELRALHLAEITPGGASDGSAATGAASRSQPDAPSPPGRRARKSVVG